MACCAVQSVRLKSASVSVSIMGLVEGADKRRELSVGQDVHNKYASLVFSGF